MKQIYIESYFKNYNKLLDYNSLINHPKYGEIEKRVKVIEFFEKYGVEGTREAFGVGRLSRIFCLAYIITKKSQIKELVNFICFSF